jgi:hypothetical protein
MLEGVGDVVDMCLPIFSMRFAWSRDVTVDFQIFAISTRPIQVGPRISDVNTVPSADG